MKKILFLFIGLTLALSASADRTVIRRAEASPATMIIAGGGGGAGGGVTCSGDFSSEQYESFESGAGTFCTTDWSETDADADISTYDGTFSNCGDYGMEITGDTAGDSWAEANLGAADNDFYLRFYLNIPTHVGAWDQANALVFIGPSDYPAYDGEGLQLKLAGDEGSGVASIFHLHGASYSSETITTSDTGKHRIELHVLGSGGTSVLRVWDPNGDPILTSNGGADYELGEASANANMQYIEFTDHVVTAWTWQIDDVYYDAVGGSFPMGIQTCD